MRMPPGTLDLVHMHLLWGGKAQELQLGTEAPPFISIRHFTPPAEPGSWVAASQWV